ncbi:MAG: hypothetical protein WBQ65_00675, partial [Bryobacteraceae bacterium]
MVALYRLRRAVSLGMFFEPFLQELGKARGIGLYQFAFILLIEPQAQGFAGIALPLETTLEDLLSP